MASKKISVRTRPDAADVFAPAEAADRLKATLAALSDLYFILDRQGRILDYRATPANQPFLPPRRFLGRKMTDVLPEPAAGIVRKALARAARCGRSASAAYPLPYRDGERWYEASIAVQGSLRNPDRRFICLARDITERVRAERALRESEERFAQTAQVSRSFVWEVDARGRYVYASSGVKDVLGYRAEELVGRMHFYDFYPGRDCQRFKRDCFAAFRRGRPIRNFVNLNRAKDGRLVWTASSATPQLNAHGRLRGYRGIDIDVTERIRAEQALRESERRFAESARQSRTYLWEVDADGLYVYVSPVVAYVLGYAPEEIVGRLHYHDLFPPAVRDQLTAEIQAAIDQRRSFRDYENPLLAKDGRTVWVITSAIPQQAPDGSFAGYRGSDTDITERKEAELALRESTAQRRAINDNLPDGFIYQMDSGVNGEERRYTYLSQGIERLHGVTVEEAMRDPAVVYRQIVAEDRPAVIAQEARALATMSPFQVITRVRILSGEIRWRLFSSAPRRLPNGHVVWDGIELDITERKQAELALQESEAQRRAIHDNLPNGLVYHVDSGVRGNQRRLIFISKGVERMHGVSVEAALQDASFIYAQMLPEDRDRLVQCERKAVAARRPFSAETRVRLPSGEIRWRLFSSAPRRLPNGHLVWDGIELDITKRKQAEEALQRSEAKYRQLYEAMRDPFATTDLKGRLLDCNPAFLNLLGYERDELLGRNFRDVTPRKWHAREKRIVVEQVRKRGYSSVYEKEYVRKDGTVVPVELRTMLVCDDAGRPAGLSAVVRDVSERKRAERALRAAHDELEQRVRARTAELEKSRAALARSEEQFRQMAHSIEEAFWLIDARTWKILYVSPAFDRIWNRPARTRERHIADWLAAIHPEDRKRVEKSFEQGMKTGMPGTITYRLIWPDGSIRWIESSGSMIRDRQGHPLRAAGVVRDITERRKLEAEILNAGEAERQRLGRDLHDSLGQSLTGIGYLAEAVRESLARRDQPEAAELQKLSGLIGQTADQAHALAQGLLLADLKRGGLGSALQELAYRTQELFGVACRYAGPAAVPLADAATAGQLYRIAQEAAANAAKHSRARTIEIRLENADDGLHLTVRDDGRGLVARKTRKGGLGLDIMRYRAGLIGAALWIDSTQNRGTTVHCLVPLSAPRRRPKRENQTRP